MNLPPPPAGLSLSAVEASPRWRRAVLLAGLLLTQLLVFWPSLFGSKVLLPVDLLSTPRNYPITEPTKQHDFTLLDLVASYQPFRQFAADEFRAGRLPMWHPGMFGGTPFAQFGKYSPYNLIYYAAPGPAALAWIQVIKSLVLGLGAYVFLRRVARVSYWPATAVAWCLPWTGYFVVWQGFPVSWVASWLPWLLLATDAAVRRPLGWGVPALAGVTAVTILTGHVDVAAQLMLTSGVYALWCCGDAYGWRPGRGHALPLGAATVGWLAGLLLASPYLLPLFEYLQTGARLGARADGPVERLPVGWQALPQFLIPDFFGHTKNGSWLIPSGSGNMEDGPVAGYAGMVGCLVLAPLAWCQKGQRSLAALCVGLVVLGWSWDLNLPGFTTLLQLPVLQMLSHVRLVCVATFGIAVLAALGLEAGRAGEWRWHRGFVVLLCASAGLVLWCAANGLSTPAEIGAPLRQQIEQGRPASDFYGPVDAARVARIESSLLWVYVRGAALAGCVFWTLWTLRQGRLTPRRWAPALVGVWLAELLCFGWDFNPQNRPADFYPPSPVLETLKRLPPGRVIPLNCLPANLLASQGLREVRGYDGVDPRRVVELLDLVRSRQIGQTPFPTTQDLVPNGKLTDDGRVELDPALNLFNVRYLICWGDDVPGLKPLVAEPGSAIKVVENRKALPRAYVPTSVRVEPSAPARLKLIAAPNFDPRQVGLVEVPLELGTNCAGRAEIVAEVPSRVELRVDMETPGLVVLADQWNDGWRATLNDQPVAIHRANHALRGVVAPAGTHRLVFEYAPASFTWGLRCLAAGCLLVATWAGWGWRVRQRNR